MSSLYPMSNPGGGNAYDEPFAAHNSFGSITQHWLSGAEGAPLGPLLSEDLIPSTSESVSASFAMLQDLMDQRQLAESPYRPPHFLPDALGTESYYGESAEGAMGLGINLPFSMPHILVNHPTPVKSDKVKNSHALSIDVAGPPLVRPLTPTSAHSDGFNVSPMLGNALIYKESVDAGASLPTPQTLPDYGLERFLAPMEAPIDSTAWLNTPHSPDISVNPEPPTTDHTLISRYLLSKRLNEIGDDAASATSHLTPAPATPVPVVPTEDNKLILPQTNEISGKIVEDFQIDNGKGQVRARRSEGGTLYVETPSIGGSPTPSMMTEGSVDGANFSACSSTLAPGNSARLTVPNMNKRKREDDDAFDSRKVREISSDFSEATHTYLGSESMAYLTSDGTYASDASYQTDAYVPSDASGRVSPAYDASNHLSPGYAYGSASPAGSPASSASTYVLKISPAVKHLKPGPRPKSEDSEIFHNPNAPMSAEKLQTILKNTTNGLPRDVIQSLYSTVDGYVDDSGEKVPRKYKCLLPDCGRQYPRKSAIESHIQTHLEDKPYRCRNTDCTAAFVRQHDLRRHEKIHLGTKPHQCSCGKSFARGDALTRHKARNICEGGAEKR